MPSETDDDALAAQIAALPWPVRRMLKETWAKTSTKPLHLTGPNMRRAAQAAARLGLVYLVVDGAHARTWPTREGFRLAVWLRVRHWPDCARPAREGASC